MVVVVVGGIAQTALSRNSVASRRRIVKERGIKYIGLKSFYKIRGGINNTSCDVVTCYLTGYII